MFANLSSFDFSIDFVIKLKIIMTTNILINFIEFTVPKKMGSKPDFKLDMRH